MKAHGYGYGGSAWDHVSIDFTTLGAVDIDHTAGTFELGDYTWNQGTGSGTPVDDLDIVEGVGLRLDMSATNSTIGYRLTSATYGWWAALPLQQVWADYDILDTVVVRAKLAGIGDAVQERHGIGIGNGRASTAYQWVSALVGYMGTAVGANRTNIISTLTDGNAPKGSFDCVQVISGGPTKQTFAGVLSAGDYPASWTGIGTNSTGHVNDEIAGNNTADRSWTAALTEVLLCAATGNTSNNFTPVWKQLDIYRLKTVGLP